MSTTKHPRDVTAPAKRFQLAIDVAVHFLDDRGAVIDHDVYPGTTRDLSRSGLGLEVRNISPELAASLDEKMAGLRLQIDFDLASRPLRVPAKCTWLRWVSLGEQRRCLLGASYDDADSDIARRLISFAEVRVRRRRLWLGVAALVLVALLALLAWWVMAQRQVGAYMDHSEALASIEKKLGDATVRHQALRAELLWAQDAAAIKDRGSDESAKPEGAAQAEVTRLQDELRRAQYILDELSVTLVKLRTPPSKALAESPFYHVGAGELFAAEGEDAAALAEFERAIELDPNQAQAYLGAADLLSAYGQKKKAIAYYERFLSLSPGSDEAEDIRDEIKELRGGPETTSPGDTQRP